MRGIIYRLAVCRFKCSTIRSVERNVNSFNCLYLLFGYRIDRILNCLFRNRCNHHGGSDRECTVGISNLNEELVLANVLLVNLGLECFFFKLSEDL